MGLSRLRDRIFVRQWTRGDTKWLMLSMLLPADRRPSIRGLSRSPFLRRESQRYTLLERCSINDRRIDAKHKRTIGLKREK